MQYFVAAVGVSIENEGQLSSLPIQIVTITKFASMQQSRTDDSHPVRQTRPKDTPTAASHRNCCAIERQPPVVLSNSCWQIKAASTSAKAVTRRWKHDFRENTDNKPACVAVFSCTYKWCAACISKRQS
jgi:hypothetical protein